MDKKSEEKNEYQDSNNSEDEWESIPEKEQNEDTKDILYRLNIEGASKIKLDLYKKKHFHSLKVKKLDSKEKESFYDLEHYIKEEYMPNITINQNYNANPYASILNNDYIIKKHPEIGTCLIFEMDDKKQEANLIGKSDTWYETTVIKPKIRQKINKNNNFKISKSLILIKKKKKEQSINNNNSNSNINFNSNNINENKNITFLKKKKKRKKKIKYTKNSTIIEIKRIFDNQDQGSSIKEKENK